MPYFSRAQSLVEAGPFIYDKEKRWAGAFRQHVLPLASGGVYTSWFQFSKTRNSVLPTHFGERYADDLKRHPHLHVYNYANVTGLRLSADASRVDHVDVATLSGRRFRLQPKQTVLATGAMENARLLLASNDVMKAGVGNGYDLVGRYFADHPIPRGAATLVMFGGQLAPFYLDFQNVGGAVIRATFSPRPEFQREKGVLGSLTTVDGPVDLDNVGQQAVRAVASALDIDASAARAFSLGCGMELVPDPHRRLSLSNALDPLGMQRLHLTMTVADSDFANYRLTLAELGRQLLGARLGMIRLDRKERDEWLEVLDWGNHHMGTTRMSNDARSGVVDANLRVHGVSNLFVAGSSTFPTYGSSNPTLNLVALSLRLADHLRGLFT
jgi:choline dehydrogenase-like flavoprotein